MREEHVLSLEEAIRKFSALPAQRMRLIDRGVLKQGMWADVVIFDPASMRDLATFEQPNQLSQGMEYVLVNGVPVIAQGRIDCAPCRGKCYTGRGYTQEVRNRLDPERSSFRTSRQRNHRSVGKGIKARWFVDRPDRIAMDSLASSWPGISARSFSTL